MSHEHLQDAARRQAEVQVDLQSLWRRVHRGRQDRRRRRNLSKLALTAVLAATLGGLATWRSTLAPEVPAVHEAHEAWTLIGAKAAAGEALQLPDGSWLRAEAGAELALLSLEPDRLHLALGQGVVDFQVVPGGPRAWVIDAGLAEIRVIGTRFTVSRGLDVVEVQVQEGRVLVRGGLVPGGERSLGPGEGLQVRPRVAPAGPTMITPEPPPPAPAVRRPGRQTKTDAKASAPAAPTPEPTEAPAQAPRPSLDDWLAEAEAARARGDDRTAAARWTMALAHFPDAPSMSLIAFRLGRLQLEALAEPAAAARAIEQALALGLPKALEEDAYARLVEAYAKAQDPTRARDAKARYRAAFPETRRRAEVEKWSP